MIITIDGPVASGKSSVAKQLAQELDAYYLYTGLLYRAVAHVLVSQIEKERGEAISTDMFEKYFRLITAERLDFIKNLTYDYGKEDSGEARPFLFCNEEEITPHLYHSKLDQMASIVSADKRVREALLPLQREVAERYDIIADGRDCGSVVFPNADFKFYLTARVDVRAERLMLDERRDAVGVDVEKVQAGLEERDKRDQEREVAPLMIPEGAITIDNSDLTFQETVDRFLAVIHA